MSACGQGPLTYLFADQGSEWLEETLLVCSQGLWSVKYCTVWDQIAWQNTIKDFLWAAFKPAWIKSCWEGQDLGEIVVQGRDDTTPPQKTNYQELKKWKVQAGKAMFIIKVSVERRKIWWNTSGMLRHLKLSASKTWFSWLHHRNQRMDSSN